MMPSLIDQMVKCCCQKTQLHNREGGIAGELDFHRSDAFEKGPMLEGRTQSLVLVDQHGCQFHLVEP